MHHHEKGTPVKPTEQAAKSAPLPKTGLLVALRALLLGQGSGAPSSGCAGESAPAHYVLRFALVVCPFLALVSLAFSTASAQAAVTHEYLPAPSKEISKGVPKEEPPKQPEERLSGPLGQPVFLTVDSGSLWVDEFAENQSRVDKYNASSGAFMSQIPVSQFNQTPPLQYVINGVAVGHATGETELYVGADAYPTENGGPQGSVAVFGAGGELQGVWLGADTPNKAFGCFVCNGRGDVSVDNSSSLGDWAAGDVYVAAVEEGVVDVFKPEAHGKEKYVTQIKGSSPTEPFSGPEAVVVDEANGDVIVSAGSGAIDIFKPTVPDEYEFVRQIKGTPRGSFERVNDIAVGGGEGEGDIYAVAHVRGGEEGFVVDQFNSEGVYLGALTGISPSEPFIGAQSVGVDPKSHDVYVGVQGAVDVFAPNIVIPAVTTSAASGLTATSAVLNGAVNPVGAGEATCQFQYGTSTSYGQFAPCAPEEVANGTVATAVESKSVKGLRPDTTYHYRLDATNADGHQNTGICPEDCGEFITPGVGVMIQSVAEVASTSVSVQATVAPNGSATSYYFQLSAASTEDCTPSTCSDIPDESGVPIGPGPGEVSFEQHVQGLAPGTVYHYRVIALSEVPVEVAPGKLETELQPFYGPDQTFTTQGSGAFTLPDDRQWEMVSPPQKNGATIEPLNSSEVTNGVIEAAANGDAFTYVTEGATETEGAAGYDGAGQVLARRVGTGASTWASQDLQIPQSHGAGLPVGQGQDYRVFSEDLSLAIVQPIGAFTPCTNSEGFKQPCLSEAASEQTAFLRTNFYNGNVAEPCNSSCYRPLVTGCPGEGKPCPPAVKEIADVPEGTIFGAEGQCPLHTEFCGPQFTAATPNLSTIQLGNSIAGGVGKVEWCAGKLMASCPGGVPPVRVDESEDGSWKYAVSGNELQVSHAGTTRLVAVLSGEDVTHWETSVGPGGVSKAPEVDERVSSNGRWLAFMSQEPLTGYDNRDEVTDKRDYEVFLYHAPENLATESGNLICASCNPTGARPLGLEDIGLYSNAPRVTGFGSEFPEHTAIAATIPGWSQYRLGIAFYESRYLSNSGRLFFNTIDGLVPKDVNGQWDVYEYEPEGVGPQGATCGSSIANGSEVFKPAHSFEVQGRSMEESAGCVALISSGTSGGESAFLDASETGGDVFFMTTSKLAPQDFDDSYDVYDAHECSAAAPCSTVAAVLPPCITAEACRVAPAPQPAIFGAPSSSTFSGAGNITPESSAPMVKPKALSRAQKLAAALQVCKRDKAKRKRVSCEASAHRKNGVSKKSSKKSSKTSTLSRKAGR